MTMPNRRLSASAHENLPYVSTISESRPLARTPHTCTICGLPIAIGSRYSKHVLCNHDSFDRKKRIVTVRWHLPFCPKGEAQDPPRNPFSWEASS